MKNIPGFAARTAAVWLALLVGGAAGGMLLPLPPVSVPPSPEPLGASQAFLIVSGAGAIVMAALASRLTGSRAARFATLLATFFMVETVLALFEAVVFGASLQMPPDFLLRVAGGNLIKAALGAAAAAALFRPAAVQSAQIEGLHWKVPAIAALYVFAYFAAGFLVAWQSAAIRDFYGEGGLVPPLGLLAGIQVVRGLMWAAVAVLLFSRLAGSTAAKALRTGAAFALPMGMSLLFPSGFMPWPIRSVHMIEVMSSNFLFGVAAAMLLGVRSSRRQAQQVPAQA